MRPLLPPRPPAGRAQARARLAGTEWDLLVVGAGASGASVAREAARRGLSVALVEQDDISSGTSSRSSRLIHGGLRYLAHGDLGLVREGLRERRRLLDSAPGLVRTVRFLYPIYRGDPDGRLAVACGLGLYGLLGLGDGFGFHRRLDPATLRREFPLLRTDGLRAAYTYRDGAAHDARLTLALAIAAAERGALVMPRCRVRRVHAAGATIEDRLTGAGDEVRAGAVLLACGPFAGLLEDGPPLRTARGAHLAVPSGRLPLAGFVALRSPGDGRLVFAMPSGQYSVLGTTDVDDATAPADVHATADDVDYLLRAARQAFPGAELGRQDVTGVWAGLRPLLAQPGANPDQLSRRHVVVEGRNGVFALVGGKLTTHRAMAQDALERIARRVGWPRRVSSTPAPLLSGSLAAGAARLRALGTSEAQVAELGALYGARLSLLADRCAAATAHGAEGLERAQVELAAETEWAWSLDDLLLRRTLPGPLDLRRCAQLAPRAAELLGGSLGWSARERDLQTDSFVRGVREDLRLAGLEHV